ncbi:hypothetical protein BDP27DRAFT_1429717 [Rhodocollybia butyracea]|uniref:Uncharacterized protein n=1 Tax=Rhodocollybia butyracea TaxID=206335 RepID=A0A9P5TZY6_9AGAR|nr:hypothetical protein BDP27DRAFT_1429717 [Rhodocollybia butyracea]
MSPSYSSEEWRLLKTTVKGESCTLDELAKRGANFLRIQAEEVKYLERDVERMKKLHCSLELAHQNHNGSEILSLDSGNEDFFFGTPLNPKWDRVHNALLEYENYLVKSPYTFEDHFMHAMYAATAYTVLTQFIVGPRLSINPKSTALYLKRSLELSQETMLQATQKVKANLFPLPLGFEPQGRSSHSTTNVNAIVRHSQVTAGMASGGSKMSIQAAEEILSSMEKMTKKTYCLSDPQENVKWRIQSIYLDRESYGIVFCDDKDMTDAPVLLSKEEVLGLLIHSYDV